jgi:ubiquinone/menaquinone biosynthesis C-methylase UbiE
MNNKKIEELYDDQCRQKPSSWEACLWASEDEQYGRFVIFGSHIFKNSTVLDVGCGQGDFGIFLKQRSITEQYFGIDISNEMVEKAKVKYPLGHYLKNDFEETQLNPCDFVTAIGSFNIKHDDNQYDYLERNLRKCFETATKAVLVSLTINPANITLPPDHVTFMYSPAVVQQIVAEITDYYIINTAALPMEMFVALFKT